MKLLLENNRAVGMENQGLIEIFPGCFLAQTHPTYLALCYPCLPRQQVGGHCWETFGMKIKISILSHVLNGGSPCLAHSAEQNCLCSPRMCSLVGMGGQRIHREYHATKSMGRFLRGANANSEADHGRLPGGGHNQSHDGRNQAQR